MESKKVCPLKFTIGVFRDDPLCYQCEEEKCAWWNKNCGKCAIATLAESSESVSEAAAGQRTIFVREC